MNTVSFILLIGYIVLTIVLIVKFFQISSNVEDIKNILLAQKNKPKDDGETNNTTFSGIKKGSHVVEKKTGKQYRVLSIDTETNIIVCSSNGGITNETFKYDEIELFEVFTHSGRETN